MDETKTETGSEQASGIRDWRRGFWSLFVTQFQGAFSDNAYKFLVMFLILDEMSEAEKLQYLLVTGAVFALPFIVFSTVAGLLSNRYSKRRLVIATKVAEVVIMSVALVAMEGNYIWLMIGVMFLMSTQSAFFGPAKYGLLPEMLPRARLSWGNGVLSLGTFVAIILGMLAAGFLAKRYGAASWECGLALVLLALTGLTASQGVVRVPAANPQQQIRWNYFPDFCRQLRSIGQDRVLLYAIFGNAYFWFLGALMQFAILVYGDEALELKEAKISFLVGGMAIGIGLGSLSAGYLSRGRIEYRLILAGSVGMSVCFFLLAWPAPSVGQVLGNLIGLGFCAGCYIVPQMAIIQSRPDAREKGSVIAVNAVLAFVGVFFSSIVYYGCKEWLGWDDVEIFLACGITMITVSGLIYRLVFPRKER